MKTIFPASIIGLVLGWIGASSAFVVGQHPAVRLDLPTRSEKQLPRTSPRFQSYSTHLYSSGNDGEESSPLDAVIWAAQPVVWLSLYFVQTTGAGLPAGPLGLVGAVEGLSYVVVLAAAALGSKGTPQKVSRVTILLGLAVLASLISAQGCVPNAKPLLDYSAYLPVCEATPGFLGG